MCYGDKAGSGSRLFLFGTLTLQDAGVWEVAGDSGVRGMYADGVHVAKI